MPSYPCALCMGDHLADDCPENSKNREYFLIELDTFEGEFGSISFHHGNRHMYAIAIKRADGVLEIIDNGYPTATEAREAWPQVN